MLRKHCCNCYYDYYIYHVNLKTRNNMFHVSNICLVKMLYTTSYHKQNFIKKLFKYLCHYSMNSCLEDINYCLNLDFLNGKYINKSCFPYRYILITKVVNNDFNIIDSSYKIEQRND